jgi:hypothetical protein|tara:strand:- start:757 stop:1323 length:567 start_codon:yes stop_codon:yes gene_type:complete
MDFLVGREKDIYMEIRAWSKHALEGASAVFNNLPPCPYARRGWEDDKVLVLFKHESGYQTLYKIISEFVDRYDLVLLVETAFTKEPEDYHQYLSDLNDAISEGFFIDRDMWVMGFHPSDDPSEQFNDGVFHPLVEDEYALTFIQRLSKLQQSADKLKEKGYYDECAAETDALELYQRRERLYRRLIGD